MPDEGRMAGGVESRPPSRRERAVARTLTVDAATAEVLRVFAQAGCRAILLKGPTLRGLYDEESPRIYRDADLLVAPADVIRAGELLRDLGFELLLDHRAHGGVTEPHAQEWQRAPRGLCVDLHWRLPGVAAADARAWDVLAANTARIEVAGFANERLSRVGVALLVALHAAHHGQTDRRPLDDLERAVERIDRGTWAGAARLAEELDASEAFAAGLRLTSAGGALAAELGLPEVRSPRRKLMVGDPRPGSLGLLRILDAPSGRGRPRAVLDELLPAPVLMRASSPLARRGTIGLAFAYAARLVSRTWRLPAAIRVVRQARTPVPPARPTR